MTQEISNRGAALGRVVFEILRLGSRLHMAGDALVSDAGLTSARWQVLATAAFRAEPQTVSGIARILGMARQSVQRVANELEAAGFIRLAANPAHKRARLVIVTKEGRSALALAEERRIPWTESLAAALGGADLAAAEEALASLREALDRRMPEKH
jgi:DNA-binding MarR family transcriptional regulator